MAYEKIVTAYDTEEHAEEAVRALKAAGYDADDIHKFTSDEMAEAGEGAGDIVRNREDSGIDSSAETSRNTKQRFGAIPSGAEGLL